MASLVLPDSSQLTSDSQHLCIYLNADCQKSAVMFPLLAMVALWSVLRMGEASCEEARLKCAYRTGCGMALNKYFIGCSAVLHGATSTCPEVCQHALIALTSTEEGQDLMTVLGSPTDTTV
uniref:Uncharacterized protein n=1 Tax=Timema poppense TaxID=170557 RepID=A0A7R9HC91_TIMPO|nr:unnamed protein product [Timema poppensis]